MSKSRYTLRQCEATEYDACLKYGFNTAIDINLHSNSRMLLGNIEQLYGKVEQEQVVHNLLIVAECFSYITDRATGIVATFNRHRKRIHRGNPHGRYNG